jgi:hypothetical protein
MAERATYLVDKVLPQVPVRQWVLTLSYHLRYRLAWDYALCPAVLGLYARALLACYARTARAHGIPEGRTGTVTVIQRFGSGLQLNVHFHTLVLHAPLPPLQRPPGSRCRGSQGPPHLAQRPPPLGRRASRSYALRGYDDRQRREYAPTTTRPKGKANINALRRRSPHSGAPSP